MAEDTLSDKTSQKRVNNSWRGNDVLDRNPVVDRSPLYRTNARGCVCRLSP